MQKNARAAEVGYGSEFNYFLTFNYYGKKVPSARPCPYALRHISPPRTDGPTRAPLWLTTLVCSLRRRLRTPARTCGVPQRRARPRAGKVHRPGGTGSGHARLALAGGSLRGDARVYAQVIERALRVLEKGYGPEVGKFVEACVSPWLRRTLATRAPCRSARNSCADCTRAGRLTPSPGTQPHHGCTNGGGHADIAATGARTRA
jgi:hypothetical protein